VRKNPDWGSLPILASARYPKLKPGYYIVVLARRRTQKEAVDLATGYRSEGTDCYAKQAF
jgi:hypothetical protein